MLKHFRHKKTTSYPILFALFMQLALTSLICAAAPYQANAKGFMICSSFGLKSIMLDQNGAPLQKAEHKNSANYCFHCASGGCAVALLKVSDDPVTIILPHYKPLAPMDQQASLAVSNRSPPSRAPPHFL